MAECYVMFLVLGTVFAYGQTSSGKTYTMMGLTEQEDHGILACCVNDIYNSVESVCQLLIDSTFY